MKKMLCALIALAMLLLPVGAMAEDWYLTQGLILAERLRALASDKSYCELYTTEGDVLDVIGDFAKGDYSRPEKARMLVLPDETGVNTLLNLVGMVAGEELPEMSDTVMNEITKGLPNLIPTLANGQQGLTWVAATTVVKCIETHIQPEGFTPGVLFLDYPGEYSIAVAFAKTGTETLTASAGIIPSGFIEGFTKDMPFAAKLLVNGMFRNIEVE